MGQYWKLVNKTKRQYICPSIYRDGTKFGEMMYLQRMLLYLLQNDWESDQLMFIGDHSNTENEKAHFGCKNMGLYYYLMENERKYLFYRYQMLVDRTGILDVYQNSIMPIPSLSDFEDYVVVNHSKKEYISIDMLYFDKIVNLLLIDNSEEGQPEFNPELATLWCGDALKLEKKNSSEIMGYRCL